MTPGAPWDHAAAGAAVAQLLTTARALDEAAAHRRQLAAFAADGWSGPFAERFEEDQRRWQARAQWLAAALRHAAQRLADLDDQARRSPPLSAAPTGPPASAPRRAMLAG